MYTIDNKYEIGESLWTYKRVPVYYKCPICDGNGKFEHNGYEIKCQNCSGSGKRHNGQRILETCKVTIRGIKISINNAENVSVRYNTIAEDGSHKNVKSRSETTLFRTVEEAEREAGRINRGEQRGEF